MSLARCCQQLKEGTQHGVVEKVRGCLPFSEPYHAACEGKNAIAGCYLYVLVRTRQARHPDVTEPPRSLNIIMASKKLQ